jgi:hypothetical protein
MEGRAKSGVLIVAILALLVGAGAGYILSSRTNVNTNGNTTQSNNSAEPDPATKAADLRVLLNNLETEHVSLAAAATRAGFDGDPAFQAAAASLDKNSNDLADAVGSLYGDEARSRFYEIWNSHIGFFVDYTKAAKAGDQAGMNKAVQNLNGYVEAVSDFFSKANPNLPKDAVKQLVGEHVMLLKNAVDKHGAKDYAASYKAEEEARDQIGKIADTMAGAIVKQKPGNF